MMCCEGDDDNVMYQSESQSTLLNIRYTVQLLFGLTANMLEFVAQNLKYQYPDSLLIC